MTRRLLIATALLVAACGEPWETFEATTSVAFETCPETSLRLSGDALPAAPTCIEEAAAACRPARVVHDWSNGEYRTYQYIYVVPANGTCRVTIFNDDRGSEATNERVERHDCARLERDSTQRYFNGVDCTK